MGLIRLIGRIGLISGRTSRASLLLVRCFCYLFFLFRLKSFGSILFAPVGDVKEGEFAICRFLCCTHFSLRSRFLLRSAIRVNSIALAYRKKSTVDVFDECVGLITKISHKLFVNRFLDLCLIYGNLCSYCFLRAR